MITVRFHKSLLPYTENVREVTIERDSYFFIARNCINLFPKLEKLVKQHIFSQRDDLGFVANGKLVTSKEAHLLAHKEVTVVPLVYGGGDPISLAIAAFAFSTASSILQGYSLGDALLSGVISGVFSYAGSFVAGPQVLGLSEVGIGLIGRGIVSGTFMVLSSLVQQAVVGKPPKPDSPLDDNNKIDNDTFGSIVNTVNQGVAIPLNYGLVRVGGQIISSDIEIVTQQRIADPQQEETISEVINAIESSSAAQSGINLVDVGYASSWGGKDFDASPGFSGAPDGSDGQGFEW